MRLLLTAILTTCLLLNTACIRARTAPDFRPQTGLSAVAQPFPMRLDGIHTESRVNLSGVTRLAPCYTTDARGARVIAPCTQAEDIRRSNELITRPLRDALHDAFAKTRLFSHTAAESVVLKAEIVSFEMHEGLINTGKLRIRYEFSDSNSGEILFATEIDSSAREAVFSPIDMGQSYDDAMQQTVQSNITKLLHRLQDPKYNAVLFNWPNHAGMKERGFNQ